ncbi:phage tail tube assembly chaperone [Leuconostoc citreum]|uniref:phage tail tube assembly chaperone n=1 Tax=Leuconostoc citreum TaxID=33964 RepID=UPI0015D9D58B|nr:phage tail tube assembly chaperone [Leuconostoc citreum]
MAVRTEKIKLNKLGLNKTVSVRMTMGQFDRLEELGIQLLEQEKNQIENIDNLTALDRMLAERHARSVMFGFLQEVFSLTEEDIETIKDKIDPIQFQEGFSYVSDRMRGVTDKEYEQALKAEKELRDEQEDPKKGSGESAV